MTLSLALTGPPLAWRSVLTAGLRVHQLECAVDVASTHIVPSDALARYTRDVLHAASQVDWTPAQALVWVPPALLLLRGNVSGSRARWKRLLIRNPTSPFASAVRDALASR